jgi:osmoprotectant transport system ATP-binding protein
MKMINRLVAPSSGKIYLNGRDTDEINLIELRRSIGYVIQQIGLFPNKTISDNICIVPDLLGWDKKKSRTRAAELLELVGMRPSDFLNRYPRELSGGQQQRVGVVRALAADPPVMLMDEPFGAIDPINREAIQSEFLKMQQTIKKTIVFVSHDLDEAVRMADKIAIFRAGRLEQFAAPSQLLSSPANSFVQNFLGSDRALKLLSLVNVGQAMSVGNPVLLATDPIEKAVTAALAADLPAIVSVDEHGKPVGIVSASGEPRSGACSLHSTAVRACVPVNADLRNAIAVMFANDMPVLPCVDDNGVLKGILSYRAIVQSLSSAEHHHG